MARIDTLPTLPEWAGTDESMDGWMFDTEPGAPPYLPVKADSLAGQVGELVRSVRCVEPSATFDEVARALAAANGEPVVVADAGRPLGVVRPPDVVRALLDSDQPQALSATAMMSSAVFCLTLDAPAERALELITLRGAREVAVIDTSGSVIGVVMPEDVTRALARSNAPAKNDT